MDVKTIHVIESRLKDVREYHNALVKMSELYNSSHANTVTSHWLSNTQPPLYRGQIQTLQIEATHLQEILNAHTNHSIAHIKEPIISGSPEDDKATFDRYQYYVYARTREHLQNHFALAMDYFKGKDGAWFNFCSTARDMNNNHGIVDDSFWNEARSKISSSKAFQHFVKNFI